MKNIWKFKHHVFSYTATLFLYPFFGIWIHSYFKIASVRELPHPVQNYPVSNITPPPYIYIYIYISQKFPGVPLQSPGTALEAYFNYRHPFGYGNMHQEGFRCVNFKSTLGAPQKSSGAPQEHASSFPGAPVPPNPALHTHTNTHTHTHTHTHRHRHTHTHRERKVG